MHIINIDVFFKNKNLQLQIDVISKSSDGADQYAEDLSYLTDLETLVLTILEFKKTSENLPYSESLKYALTMDSDNLSTFKNAQYIDSLSYFNASHQESEIELLYGKETALHRHHTVTFHIPPSSSYMINLLICLTIYFEQACSPDFLISFSKSFAQQLKDIHSCKNPLFKEAIPIDCPKIVPRIIRLLIEQKNIIPAYQPLIKSLEELSKKLNNDYNLLTYCEQNENFHIFNKEFVELRKQFSSNFGSEDTIKLFTEFFNRYPKIPPAKLLKNCLFIFDCHTEFKNKLSKLTFGKTIHAQTIADPEQMECCPLVDPEDPLLHTSSTEIMTKTTIDKNDSLSKSFLTVIESADFKFCRDGKIKMSSGSEFMYGVLVDYFSQDLAKLRSYLGGEVTACFVEQEITFSQSCTPKLIELGFISSELLNTLFRANHRARFFARITQPTVKQTNLFTSLPKELLVKILQLSEDAFNVIPDRFFTHSIANENERIKENNSQFNPNLG